MFTGIVTDVGRVERLERRGELRVRMATAHDTAALATGASIACSGACLTVVGTGPGWFEVEVSDETLACTTLGSWSPGSPVNLELSLRLGDELGGHLVSGHVDGIAEVMSVTPRGESRTLDIRVPDDLARLVAPKGSIALDGVSLTVNEVAGTVCSINIIPHTLAATTLGSVAAGGRVNVEIDLIARYVARLTQTSEGAGNGGT